ncbi:MAG: hypothetical protein KAJ16_01095, partial [Calditrichia bacterium]|nr:hypothetical protein [Calditrichia bacterium]
FIMMEYIEGKELKDILVPTPQNPPLPRGDSGGLSVNDTLSYATQIAEGLQAARRECPPREGFLLEKGGAFLPLDLILYTTAPITEDLPV